jgi:hypothetical protein
MPFNAINRPHKSGKTEARRFFYDAFILPFKDKNRAYIYVTSMLFAFGAAFLEMFILLDFSDLPKIDMMYFLFIRFFCGTIIVCSVFYLISRHGGRVIYPYILGVIIASLLYYIFLMDPDSPIQVALMLGLISSPFWGIYHVLFAITASKENLGNEVSIASTGMTIGTTIGFAAGGIFAQYELQTLALGIGFLATALSIFMLVAYAYKIRLKKNLQESGLLDETLGQAADRCRYRSLGAGFDGVLQLCGGNLWIVYLSLSGISATAVGLWNAIMVLIKIIFTPIAGTLVNHGRRREMVLGSIVQTVGWAPFLIPSALVLPAMYVWSVGYQLFATGLNSTWYSTRTVSSLLLREMILGATRLISIPLLVPILYLDPVYFIIVTLIISALTIFYSLRWMKSIKDKYKGPVLAIANNVAP